MNNKHNKNISEPAEAMRILLSGEDINYDVSKNTITRLFNSSIHLPINDYRIKLTCGIDEHNDRIASPMIIIETDSKIRDALFNNYEHYMLCDGLYAFQPNYPEKLFPPDTEMIIMTDEYIFIFFYDIDIDCDLSENSNAEDLHDEFIFLFDLSMEYWRSLIERMNFRLYLN